MATVTETIQALEVAAKALQMYTAQHPRTQGSLQAAKEALQGCIGDRPSLHLAVAQDKVFADGVKLETTSAQLRAFAKRLSDRMIAGFVISKAMGDPDILAMLNLLLLKPAKIEELGGPARVLEDSGASQIRVSQTRYKEVGEGGEGDNSEERGPGALDEAPPENPAEAVPASAPDPIQNLPEEADISAMLGPPEHLIGIVREALDGILGLTSGLELPTLANLQPAFLGDLGAMGYQLGLGEGMPSMAQMSVLRQVLLGLSPEAQLSLLAGLATLPGKPEGLALGIRELAPELLGVAGTALLGQGIPWNHLQGSLQDVLRPLPEREILVRALAIHMRQAGYDGGLAEALLRRMDWDAMTLEAKVVRALEDRQLWDLSLEQRLAFLRELLDDERMDPFQRILGRVMETLQVEDHALRLAATQTLAGVSHWIRQPGLPQAVEAVLAQKLQAHFAVESSAQIHESATEALGAIVSALVLRGEATQAQAFLMELADLCGIHEQMQSWRQDSLDQLKARLLRSDCMDRTVDLLCEVDKDTLSNEVIPYLEWLGPDAPTFLMVKLSSEVDRPRRGRLIEALRTLGPLALGAVLEALQEKAWFVVRNALNLLGDIGDAGEMQEAVPLLRHPEGRVRRAAVRALWKLGGPASEPHLLSILKETDPETQMEVLFALGQVKTASSAPAVVELAEDRRVSDRLRIKALETLGLIGAPTAIPALCELLKRKGFFGGGSEAPDIKLGAAKALQGIGTPEARWGLQKVIESCPRGHEREALQRVLETFIKK